MKLFVFSVVLLVALPVVKPNVCPDHSTCPGADTCCSASSGYRCCPFPNGNCCSGGQYCCAAGYICIPGLNICILPFSNNNINNINEQKTAIMETSSLTTKSEKSLQISQCPSGTTECQPDMCCPLPNAVCCSDNQHCCPEGYSCDSSEDTCTKNYFQKLQSMIAPVKKVKSVVCPDGGQCIDGSTCCMMAGGEYGCCNYPQAVCCSDGIHCCPSGTTCDGSGGTCNKGEMAIRWIKKQPAIKPKQQLIKINN